MTPLRARDLVPMQEFDRCACGTLVFAASEEQRRLRVRYFLRDGVPVLVVDCVTCKVVVATVQVAE